MGLGNVMVKKLPWVCFVAAIVLATVGFVICALGKHFSEEKKRRLETTLRLARNARSLSKQRLRMQQMLEGPTLNTAKTETDARRANVTGTKPVLWDYSDDFESLPAIPHPGWSWEESPSFAGLTASGHGPAQLVVRDPLLLREDKSTPRSNPEDIWEDPSDWDPEVFQKWVEFSNKSKLYKVKPDNWWDINTDVAGYPVGPAIDTDWNK
eukprot:jgi/Botrbrau1/8350/Bobra.0046s0012.1